MIVDVHEPDLIADGLSKRGLTILRESLQGRGLCDYAWDAHDGHTITVERKTISDFLAHRLRLEQQLKKALKAADEVVFLLEGVYTSHRGGIQVWAQDKKRQYFYRSQVRGQRYRAVQATLSRFQKCGVDIAKSDTIEGTVETLVALCNNSQKSTFQTFARYIREKPILLDPDPDIEFLCSLPKCGISEKRARLLVEHIGNRWKILNSSEEELCRVPGIGKTLAHNIFRAIGRE